MGRIVVMSEGKDGWENGLPHLSESKCSSAPMAHGVLDQEIHTAKDKILAPSEAAAGLDSTTVNILDFCSFLVLYCLDVHSSKRSMNTKNKI